LAKLLVPTPVCSYMFLLLLMLLLMLMVLLMLAGRCAS
jgi:hypothetical protein